MVEIKILASRCAVNDEYYKAVKQIAEKNNLSFNIEKVTDLDIIKSYGVSVQCLYGYCPGCASNHQDITEPATPALVINNTVVHHSDFPPDEILEKEMIDYINNND